MKLLTNITDQDINPNAPKKDHSSYELRTAARAVLLNDKNEVFLLNVSNRNYHKLPGGGVEKGEDLKTALLREIMEETGCKATVDNEVGKIIEYRDSWKLIQTSYCYIARQHGKIVAQSLEDGEIEEGHDLTIIDNIDAAITLLKKDTPSNSYVGPFIQIRDLAILETAKTLLA